ncbi:MAG: hypothetical protein U0Q07_09300 [Acidimicrobiales bacterium]
MAVVLLIATFAVGTGASFSSDEGAAIVQAKHLAAGQGWILENPFPALDPTGERSFLALSDHGANGTAAYSKHPTYPVVLAGLDRIGGVTAMVLLSVLGTLVAAGLAARLAARFGDRYARPTVWAVAIGSPLLFDSQLVIAHSLGAALAAGALLAVVRARERWSWAMVVVAAACLGAACLLRNEAILLSAVVAVVLLWAAVRTRAPRLGVLAVAVVGAAGLAAVFDRVASARIIGAAFTAAGPVSPGSDFLSSRIGALASTAVLPGDSWPPVAQVGLMLVFGGVTAAGLAARTRPDDARLVRFGCGAAVLGVVLAFAGGQPDTIPGLFVACPFLWAGLLLVRRQQVATEPARFLAAVVVAFVVLVVLVQYSQAGAAEWGARFLAIVLPAAVPLALVSIDRAGRRLAPADARIGLVSLVVVTAAISVLSLWSLHHYKGLNRDWTRFVASAADDWRDEVAQPGGDGRPVVITTWAGLGRLMWPEDVDVRGMTVEATDLRSTLEQLRAAGVTEVVYVAPGSGPDREAFRGLYEQVDVRPEGRVDKGPVFLLRAI